MNKNFSLNDSDLDKASGGINGNLLEHGIFPVIDKDDNKKFVTVRKKNDGSFETKEIDKETVDNIMLSDTFMRKTYDNTGGEVYRKALEHRWNNWK